MRRGHLSFVSLGLGSILVAALLASMAAGPVAGQAVGDLGELIVTANETWAGEDRTVYDLVVRAPATLRLEGTDLRVGNRIVIEEGATLELGPLGDRPTGIGALAEGPPSKTTGFWMIVNGTLRASGTPATTIHGIRGDGLADMYGLTGGIHVGGQAILSDVHIHDGNSTLITRPEGSIVLSRVVIERMGFMGIGLYGSLSMDNSTVGGSVNGIMGTEGCEMQVRDSRIEATVYGLSDKSCPLLLERTAIVGALNGLFLSGTANATVTDTTITEYTQHGIFAKGKPDNVNQLRTRLTARGVLLDPLGRQAGSFDGLTLQGADAQLVDSTIQGNTGAGIRESDFSTLDLENVSVVRNGVGLVALGAEVDADLLETNNFGEPGSPEANEQGQIEATIAAFAFVMGHDNHTLPGGRLKVFGIEPTAALLDTNTTDSSGRILGTFPAYMRIVTGHSVFLGPFTYEVSHPLLDEPLRGDLDLARPLAIAHVPDDAVAEGVELKEAGQPAEKGLPHLGFPAVVGTLVGLALLWRSSNGIQGRRSK